MVEFSTSVFAHIALGALLVSGISHVAAFRQFHEAIAAQRVWRGSAARLVASLTSVVEVVLGVTGLYLLMSGPLRLFHVRLALTMSAAVYLSYALYLQWLRLNRPGAPCGCSRIARPTTAAEIVRAGGLALIGAVSALHPYAIVHVSSTPLDWLVIAVAGVSLGLIWWQLPNAVAEPLLSVTKREGR